MLNKNKMNLLKPVMATDPEQLQFENRKLSIANMWIHHVGLVVYFYHRKKLQSNHDLNSLTWI